MLRSPNSRLLSVFQPSEKHAYSASLYERLEKFATVEDDTDSIVLDPVPDDASLTHAESLSIVRQSLETGDASAHDSRLYEALAMALSSDFYTRQLTSFHVTNTHLRMQRTVWPQVHVLGPKQLEDETVLEEVVKKLQEAHRVLLDPIDKWLNSSDCDMEMTPLVRNGTLRQMIRDWRQILLREWTALSTPLSDGRLTPYINRLLSSLTSSDTPQFISDRSSTLLRDLRDLGLSDDMQQALAYATFGVINTYVHSYDMRVDWVGRNSAAPLLQNWIETYLEPAVRACQALIGCRSSTETGSLSDQQLWSAMALDALGHNRSANLLRYVQMWDQSMGAMLDVKEFIRSPEAKRAVISSLHFQMQRDLLHAGAQTAELLTVYINLIKAFKVLDGRNVLLSKVAEPLRACLASREDTIQVIAASFLADDDYIAGTEHFCAELAQEVARSVQADGPDDLKMLDWDDMEWLPAPLDAGPDFERSRRDDIISYMLKLSDPERFYDKFRRLLCTRLLKSARPDTDMETCLVELLKSRRELDKDKLTECEVMLRDMRDSKRLLRSIRKQTMPPPSPREVWNAIGAGIEFSKLLDKFKDRLSPKNDESAIRAFCDMANHLGVRDHMTKMIHQRSNVDVLPNPNDQPDFSANILSSVFWPSLHDAEFSIPEPAAAAQRRFESHYVRFKDMRKLQWLSAQGRATVEVRLSDRQISFANLPAWHASVIYAFHSESDTADSEQGVVKTRDELATSLHMVEVLLSDALDFWVRSGVLREIEPDKFMVQEVRDAEAVSAGTAALKAPKKTELEATKSQSTLLEENRMLYETFIVNMLTNGGAMDADRIAMMLGMVVPGGFEFGGEGVQVLCSGMVESGTLVREGVTYKVKK